MGYRVIVPLSYFPSREALWIEHHWARSPARTYSDNDHSCCKEVKPQQPPINAEHQAGLDSRNKCWCYKPLVWLCQGRNPWPSIREGGQCSYSVSSILSGHVIRRAPSGVPARQTAVNTRWSTKARLQRLRQCLQCLQRWMFITTWDSQEERWVSSGKIHSENPVCWSRVKINGLFLSNG